MVGLQQCNPQSYLPITRMRSLSTWQPGHHLEEESRLKDAKNKEAKPGWNVGYNHSHAVAV